jgi:hypothetical protein
MIMIIHIILFIILTPRERLIMYLRVLSDIHCERKLYLRTLVTSPYSVQIGDFDDSYDWLEAENVDPSRHKFFTGDYDNLDLAPKSPHNLGDFGVHQIPEIGELFFVRGAYSVDHLVRRTAPQKVKGALYPRDYWPEIEQLNVEQGKECLALYKEVRPNVVLSHEAPYSIVPLISDPKAVHLPGFRQTALSTNTNGLLEVMFQSHQPKLWVFGHYHSHFERTLQGTSFFGLKLYHYMDLTPEMFS